MRRSPIGDYGIRCLIHPMLVLLVLVSCSSPSEGTERSTGRNAIAATPAVDAAGRQTHTVSDMTAFMVERDGERGVAEEPLLDSKRFHDAASLTENPRAEPTIPAAGGPGNPLIEYFRSNAKVADPGDSITLEWSVSGAMTVTLWHLAPTGQLSRFWDVPDRGSFDYTIGGHEKNWTRFALFAGGKGNTPETASLEIELRCQDEWFFVSAPNICPAGPPLPSAGAFQNFEGGSMVWVGEEDSVYILFSDEQSPEWNRFSDSWEPGIPDYDSAILPPEGFFQPVRGFGLVWREEPGVRERLGWALEQETGFETVVQRSSYARYNETYILAYDGGIWRLHPERSGWERFANLSLKFGQ